MSRIVVQLLLVVYSVAEEWNKVEEILTDQLKFKQERRMLASETVEAPSEVRFQAAIQPTIEYWAIIGDRWALHHAVQAGKEEIV